MRRAWIAFLTLVAVFCFMTSTAFAVVIIKSITTSAGTPIPTGTASTSAMMAFGDSVAFAASGPTSCQSPSSLQLAICFSLIHVGKPAVKVTATVTERITALCTNAGGNQAPGRNPVIRTATVSQPFESDKNGNVQGTIITPVPGAISAQEAGCPGNNWTATVVAVDFHGQPLDFSVDQNGSQVVAQSYILP